MKNILNSDFGIELGKKILILIMIIAITLLLPFLPESEAKKLLITSINYAPSSIYAMMIIMFILRNCFKTFIDDKQYKSLSIFIIVVFLFLFEFSEILSHKGIFPVIIGFFSFFLILATLLPLLILILFLFDSIFRKKVLIPWIKIKNFSDFFASIFTICIIFIFISIFYFSEFESILTGYFVISMYEIFCDILSYFFMKEFCKNKLMKKC
jgi:membrane protein